MHFLYLIYRAVCSGHNRWDPSGGDMAPALYTPIMYATHILAICALMMGAFLLAHFLYLRAPKPLSFSMSPDAAATVFVGSRNGGIGSAADVFGSGSSSRMGSPREQGLGMGLLSGNGGGGSKREERVPMLPISTNSSTGAYSRMG